MFPGVCCRVGCNCSAGQGQGVPPCGVGEGHGASHTITSHTATALILWACPNQLMQLPHCVPGRDVPELSALRKLLKSKFGKEVVEQMANDATAAKWQVRAGQRVRVREGGGRRLTKCGGHSTMEGGGHRAMEGGGRRGMQCGKRGSGGCQGGRAAEQQKRVETPAIA